MNYLNMTLEDWQRYFAEQNNPAIEFIDNLIQATKKEFIPAVDADLIRQQINFKMRELNEMCKKLDGIQQARSIENWKS